MSLFDRLKAGLNKTRANLANNLETIFTGAKIDEEFYSDLEDTLIMADVGVATTTMLLDKIKDIAKEKKVKEPPELKGYLIEEIQKILMAGENRRFDFKTRGKVYLIVGVNGVGKTTTIAKLVAKFKEEQRQVMVVAGDTFRAAAIEQLMTWGDRLKVPVIHHQEGADPAAVVYDGLTASQARQVDALIIDTAGRLHTKVNLMEELKKVKRVAAQNLGERTLETILVLDATTGQNAVNQTQVFHEALGVDGLILTKLDGTAKGGIVIAIANQFKIPIYMIGLGEQAEDLQTFEPVGFSKALFE